MRLQSSNLIAAAVVAATPMFAAANTPTTAVLESAQPALGTLHGNARGRSSPSAEGVRKQFARLRELRTGWDGERAAPIAEELIGYAAGTLDFVLDVSAAVPMPSVVPCADGSIQAEWHEPGGRFEIYFETDGSVESWWLDRASGREIEAEGNEAIVLLSRWAHWSANTGVPQRARIPLAA